MISLKNPKSLEQIKVLKMLLPDFNKNNIQGGTRFEEDLGSSSLLWLSEDFSHFVGLYCDMDYGHIHYKVHINFTSPKIEILAGNPEKALEIIEEQLGVLTKQAKQKVYRDKYNLKRKAEGKEVGGPGANCKGVYVWSGDGFTPSSRACFQKIINSGRITDYFAEHAPSLGFYAVCYPSITTFIDVKQFDEGDFNFLDI